ncbi:MAG TPA: hypothetical protein VFE65_37100 [Pseudonocardia sp.]|jgi:alkylation response protein AidB-like acyl-CoA dehydrogenase|nr:hypothetical protein [Pseudonocardia sp.]
MGIIEHPVERRARPADRAAHWVALASRVGAELPTHNPAAQRLDHELGDKISLLKDAGLVTVMAPAQQGGGDQQWPIAYQVVREIASADEHIAHLLAQHFLWSWLVQRAATSEQADAIQTTATRNRWFFAGTLPSPAHELRARDDSDYLVFNGRQKFTTGSGASDVTVLDGRLDGTTLRPLAVVPTRHPGLTFHTDADDHEENRTTPADQRTIRNNGVCIAEVRVPDADVLGLSPTTQEPFVSDLLRERVAQLLLTNVAIGVIRGGLRAAQLSRRARPGQGHEDRALAARLRTTETLADRLATIAFTKETPTVPLSRQAEPARHLRAVRS